MLLYSNKGLFRMMLHRDGSVLYSWESFIGGLICGGLCFFIQVLINNNDRFAPRIEDSYAMAALGAVVSFALVFRTQLAWQRYWEALTQIHYMYSKWEDTFVQFSVFVQASIESLSSKTDDPESVAKAARLVTLSDHVLRWIALLSACAADRLALGDTTRMDRRRTIGYPTYTWNQQVCLRKTLKSRSLAEAGTLPTFAVKGQEGHDSKKTAGDEWEKTYTVIGLPTADEKELLDDCQERVTIISSWILSGIVRASKDLDVPPPIQSRMYQELSNGMAGFCACVKIADVPFPFPYAQFQVALLAFFVILSPVYIAVFTQSLIGGPILSLMMFRSVLGLNEVAQQMENPFGTDTNDISLVDFHDRFLDALAEIEMAHTVHKQTMRQIEDNPQEESKTVDAA